VRIVWLSSKGAARYLTGTSRPAFRHQNIACEVLAKMGLTITNYSFLVSGKYKACPDHAVTGFYQNIILKIIIVYARSRDNDRACLFPTKWPFLSPRKGVRQSALQKKMSIRLSSSTIWQMMLCHGSIETFPL